MSDRGFYGPADSWLEDKKVVFAEEYHKLERELAEADRKRAENLALANKLADDVTELSSRFNEARREWEELNAWKTGKKGIEDFYQIREELWTAQRQLTAHKEALWKCEEVLLELNESGGYLVTTETETCCSCGAYGKLRQAEHDEGCLQPKVDAAIAAIAKCKEGK